MTLNDNPTGAILTGKIALKDPTALLKDLQFRRDYHALRAKKFSFDIISLETDLGLTDEVTDGDVLTVLIAREYQGDVELSEQVAGMEAYAIDALYEVADTFRLDLLRLTGVSDQATLVAGESHVSVWQENLIAVLFETTGVLKDGDKSVVVDYDKAKKRYCVVTARKES